MKIKVKEGFFTPLEWCVITTEIAEGYFTDGKYTPHFGKLNAMRVFFNSCVEEYNDEKPEKVDALDGIEIFVNDNDFLKAYANTVWNWGSEHGLSFSTAYYTAMDMVEQRSKSWGELANILADLVKKLIDSVKDFASEDNIELLNELANKISAGDINADSIVEAYKNNILNK